MYNCPLKCQKRNYTDSIGYYITLDIYKKKNEPLSNWKLSSEIFLN